MKVAILCPTFFTFSGIDRVAEQQAKELTQNGNEVTIFTLKANMKPPENVKLQILGMPSNSLAQRVYRLLFPLDFVKAIRWVPKLKGFDAIYSHQYPLTWLAYLAKKFYGAKYIYYNHGVIASHEAPLNLLERSYKRLASFPTKWTVKRADGAISISQYLQQELKKQVSLDSEVIYNKIDIQRFHKGVDGSKIRERHNLADAPVILFVGRISPHKGIHLLIDAFNVVKQELPNVKLLIVGKHTFSGYSKKLKQMIDDSVIFIGELPDEDLPYYYAACNVYATASLWEGFDLPLAEAQACGKPVVAFDIGAHKEVIGENSTGLLVLSQDIEALADAIIKLLNDKELANEMGENGRRLIEEKYSWKRVAKMTEKVYEELI